jgi:lipoprotein NlpD
MLRLGLLSLCLLALGGCSDFYLQNSPAPVSHTGFSASQAATSAPSQIYRVKKGDTLSAIARRYGTTYQKLAALNQLNAPYTLYPGQRLNIQAQRTAPLSASASSKPALKTTKTVLRQETSASRPVSAVPYQAGNFPSDCRVGGEWRWPTQSFQSIQHGSNVSPSLKIYGNYGQTVYAAAPGKVMYSGAEPGLSGRYNNLVILQHNSAYHSVYAGNRSVRVQEGAYVNAGQALAEMGLGSQQRPVLRFEIRCRDKAVNPLLYLPRS